MATADERAFVVFERGDVRDNVILGAWRNTLRASVNPETGVTFTEDEITRATQPGSRFYIEADAIDLYGMARQQRALWFAQQIDPRKANSAFLETFHGRLWLGPDSKLPAVGASGPALATGVATTVIPGSTTLGDPTAAVAVDGNGVRFQVLQTVVIPSSKQVTVTMQAINGGFSTRLAVGTVLTWSTGINPGTDPTADVLEVFDGGFDEETDEEYAARIEERIRERPASGNATHFQTWAAEASNAVQQAFVYPVALNAGTVLVVVTEKRGDNVLTEQVPEGPNARVPAVSTLEAVADYLIAPASPVVPQRVSVFVAGPNMQESDLVVLINMAKGRNGGWGDAVPWPAYSQFAAQTQIKTVSGDGLTLTVNTDIPLVNNVASLSGVDAPAMMLWDVNVSRWVKLDVASVTDPVPGSLSLRDFTIVLNTEPLMYDSSQAPRTTPVIAVGERLSPYTDRLTVVAEALEDYFDGLGPGEIVSTVDARYARGARQPFPSSKYPIRAGQAMITNIIDALSGTASDGQVIYISRNEPDLPSNPIDGPNMVSLGNVNIFPF